MDPKLPTPTPAQPSDTIVEQQDSNISDNNITGQNDSVSGNHALQPAEENKEDEPPFTTFTVLQRKLIVSTISFIGLLSPLSASVYFPAINTLANDLHVSIADINLTITTYLIFQALGPTLFANLSDIHGRRPAYLCCLTITLIANIALALQTSYPALLVLRCLQSTGCAATIALGSAVVADVSTRAERGKWIAYASMGIVLGPALGPTVGGLLDSFLGWRAIFWFLAIFAGVAWLVVLAVLPETCRSVVGNGDIPPQRWNRTLWSLLRDRRNAVEKSAPQALQKEKEKVKKRPNPIASLKVVLKKEDGIILLFGSLLYGSLYILMVTLTDQLQERYHFNTLQVGLCYIPLGVGSMASRFTVGLLLDRNYKRLEKALSSSLPPGAQNNKENDNFPIEKARLQIAIPAAYASALVFIIYGWVMNYRTSLAGPLIMLFLVGNCVTGAFNVFNTLIVDINLHQPATAVAASNLTRCLTGAAFTAFAQPLIKVIGIGWTGTAVAILLVAASPCLWVVLRWGPKWRKAEKEKMRLKLEAEKQKAGKKAKVEEV